MNKKRGQPSKGVDKWVIDSSYPRPDDRFCSCGAKLDGIKVLQFTFAAERYDQCQKCTKKRSDALKKHNPFNGIQAEGWTAFHVGRDRKTNPYYGLKQRTWQKGWIAAKLAEDQGKTLHGRPAK